MASDKVWIGRAVLLVIIAGIVAALIYLFITSEMMQQSQQMNLSTTQKKPALQFSKKDSLTLVKKAYESYIKKAYNEKAPNPAAALEDFKEYMTIEGQQAISKPSKSKDLLLCTEGKPDSTSYTEPTELGTLALISVVSIVKDKTVHAVVTVNMTQGKIASVKCQ